MLALGCLMTLSCANSQVVNPYPGSLKLSISTVSVNNILNLFAGILPNYIANNKTFNLNYTDSGFGYSIDFKDLHINTLNIDKKSVDFVPGTNKVRIFLSGIDLDSQLDGTMTYVGFITLHAASLKVKNITVQVDL